MIRAPTVRRGEALTAALWNRLAGAVNEGIAAPRDKDAGLTDGEHGGNYKRAIRAAVAIERVFDPNDAEVYVDVARKTEITVVDGRTGTVETWYLDL